MPSHAIGRTFVKYLISFCTQVCNLKLQAGTITPPTTDGPREVSVLAAIFRMFYICISQPRFNLFFLPMHSSYVNNFLLQELERFSITVEKERTEAKKLMPEVRKMMQYVEVAIYSYLKGTQKPMSLYEGCRNRLAQLLQDTAPRFEDELAAYCRWIDENEQLILMNSAGPSSTSSSQHIPIIPKKSHEFFIDLAASVRCLAHTELLFVSHVQILAKIYGKSYGICCECFVLTPFSPLHLS